MPFGLLGYKILSEVRETDRCAYMAIHGIEDPCGDQKNEVSLSPPPDYLPFGDLSLKDTYALNFSQAWKSASDCSMSSRPDKTTVESSQLWQDDTQIH